MDGFYKSAMVIVGLVALLLLGITVAAAITLTLTNSSNNAREMYSRCLASGASPSACRNSVAYWGDSSDSSR